jgi:transketolase
LKAMLEARDSQYMTEVNMLKAKIKSIRKSILEMTAYAEPGLHIGASLSCVDIIATLYFLKMRHSPYRPDWPDRDRFVLSKGHAAPALYAVLAEAGYFPKDELKTVKELNSRLQGHPDMRTPGVEAPSGSLGQGISIGIGMALAARQRGSQSRVYVLVGDGECDEGQIWESLMTATHLKLNNLVLIVDRNGWQLDGRTEDIKNKVPLRGKLTSFGWETYTVDGHDVEKILDALDLCELADTPAAIVANTRKGKGVQFMEDSNTGHKMRLSNEQYLDALKQLEEGS